MKQKSYIQQSNIHLKTGWNSTRQPIISETGGPKTARPWQSAAFNKLKNKPVSAICGPPATGKNFFIELFAAEYLRLNPNNKVIIAAPQKNITENMRAETFILPSTKETVNWCPSYLNETRYNTDSTTELSRTFLESPGIVGDINSRAIIMTHNTLVNIHKELKHLLKNIMVIFDEYHHILYGENDEGFVETNQLGDLVRYILDNKSLNAHILLATATPFRGDKYPIIPDGVLTPECEYEHPYDEAWQDFAPLEHFSVDFILYKGNTYKKAMGELMGKKIEPSLIFIPNVGSRYSVGDKHKDVIECYKSISGKDKPTIKKDDVFTYVKKGKDWIRCIDLVDEDNRAEKFKVINADHANLDPTKRKIDVIIALGTMKEGANHRWLKNAYVIGARGSLREFVQMSGRLFRSAEGKTDVKVYYMLPHSTNVGTDEYEENFNEYLKATMSSLLLIKVYAPRLIETPVEGEEIDIYGHARQKTVSYINTVLPDSDDQERLLEDSYDAIVNASEEFDDGLTFKHGKITPEQGLLLKASLDAVLDDFKIKDRREEVKEEILRWFAMKNIATMLETNGMNVNTIDYDMVKDIHPLAWSLSCYSNAFGIKTFKEYREAVEKSRALWMAQFEEWRKYNKEKMESVV